MKTYLSYQTHFIFIILIFSFYLLEGHTYWILSLSLYLLFLFLFRKYKIKYFQNAVGEEGIIHAPVAGKLISIRKGVHHIFFGKNLNEFRIVLPWWKEYGIYLPSQSEIIDLITEKNGCSFSQFSELCQDDKMISGVGIMLKNLEREFLGLQMAKCPLGMFPKVNILPGDRGRNGARIGHFPLGGTVFLYLPSKYEILIDSHQKVRAGLTIIAGLPKIEKPS